MLASFKARAASLDRGYRARYQMVPGGLAPGDIK